MSNHPAPEPLTERVWTCKIGAKVGELPAGADWPLRSAVMDAFQALTGHECEFIFSGWGAEVSPSERAVINNDDDAALASQEAHPARPWLGSIPAEESDEEFARQIAAMDEKGVEAHPAPALTAELLADLKVQYGMVGTRDVDVAAWNAKLDRAIAALAHPAPAGSEPAPFRFEWKPVGRYNVRGGRVVEWEIDNAADERPDGVYTLFAGANADHLGLAPVAQPSPQPSDEREAFDEWWSGMNEAPWYEGIQRAIAWNAWSQRAARSPPPS